MNTIKNRITEAEILGELKAGRISLPPLTFRLLEKEPKINQYRLDALIEGRWSSGASVVFAAEIKALSTPKIFQLGIAVLKGAGLPKNRFPLLIVPYLSEKQLQELEGERINGVDLCGNGVVNISDKLCIFRTGKENPFPSSSPIKNVYRKNSSMVGRMFLANPRFATVNQVIQQIAERNLFAKETAETSLTVGTVSKVLAAMEQDLLISRNNDGISLLQLDTLLEKLSTNYTGPNGAVSVQLKTGLGRQALLERLTSVSAKIKAPMVATGLSSVSRYAVMQREEKLSIYCPAGEQLLNELAPSDTTSRFPDLEIIDTKDAAVFFDARKEADFYWSSPVQTYLELMKGDKRDQETAEQVKSGILKAAGRALP